MGLVHPKPLMQSPCGCSEPVVDMGSSQRLLCGGVGVLWLQKAL